MTNVLANLARMTSTTQGTGTLTLGAAVTGCLTFAAAGVTDGQVVTYAIEDYSESGAVSAREIGAGTYTSANLTLTRTTVYASTNAGSKINCSGRQHVFITAAKEDFDSFLTAAAASSAYQPLDADLTTLAASITTFGHSLVDDADAATARTTLGLGTMAVETATNYLTTAAAASSYQPLDGDLTALAALSGTSTIYYRSASNTWSAVTVSANLGFSAGTLGSALGTAATKNTGTSGNNVALLDGSPNIWSGNQRVEKASANMQINATSGDATHYCSAVSGSAATIRWSHWTGSAISDRWLFGKSPTAESGSDAGSGFDCYYYTDAGAFKGVAFQSSRVDGSFNWRGGQYSNGVTGGSKGAGTINFATLYEGGTSLAAKYGALASANVFTAAQTVRIDDATTNAVTVGATLSHTTTGTPANGIGVSLAFEAETTAGNNEVGATIEAVVTDVTSTSEDFDLVFKTMAAGAAAAERMRIKSTGTVLHGTAALNTTATDGFVYVPTCAGTPTGVPTAHTGMAPIVVDSTNNKLYFYSGGAWRDAGP